MTKYCSFDELPLLMTVEELMPVLGIGRNTAYDLVRSGQIFSIRVGRQFRIPKQSLIDFIHPSDRKGDEAYAENEQKFGRKKGDILLYCKSNS